MQRSISFYDLRFEESIAIAAPPAAGFGFFENMEANYICWHPDHLKFEWRKGRGLAVGMCSVSRRGSRGSSRRSRRGSPRSSPDRYFAFTMVNPIFRFFLPHLSFGFEPDGGGFIFNAQCGCTASVP